VTRTLLTARQIRSLLAALNEDLAARGVRGEVFVIGGAVMCLAFAAREATRDVDAVFVPVREVREAAARVATTADLPADWLNDAAKGYLSERAAFVPFLVLSHLTVSTATAEYLLAMKCLAMRLGPEFHDESDVRFLLRYLNLETYAAAVEILERFYPIARFPQKALYALEEILGR
jgi:hypothetical protein